VNFAQQEASPPSHRPLTPEALISLQRLSDLEFAPDGSRIAFVVSEPPNGEQRPLTFALRDIQRLIPPAHLFRKSDPLQVVARRQIPGLPSIATPTSKLYLLSMNGGESAPLTKGKRNISRFAWSHDGKQIGLFLS